MRIRRLLAADVTAIIQALDSMAGNRTRVVNLSLMDPQTSC